MTSTQTVESVEIWSTILTGVASSKMVPTKKLLVLGIYFRIHTHTKKKQRIKHYIAGDPSCGKSTLIHYLKNDPGPQIIQAESEESTNNFGVNNNYSNSIPLDHLDDDATNTLALGYSFIDVQDEENEGKPILKLNYSIILKFSFVSYCSIRRLSIRFICCRIHAFTQIRS